MSRATSNVWASEVFGGAQLGDARRTERLVTLAGSLAAAAGSSPAAASQNPAELEGAYRFLRNESVDADAVTAAGCRATSGAVAAAATVLAIEDTTTLSYRHQVAEELGDLGGAAKSRSRGYFVHSSLAVDGDTGRTLGLLDQRYWMRQTSKRGQRHKRKQRAYENKESFKWEETAGRIRSLLTSDVMAKVIAVCDREADVYEYLHHKLAHGERFVVRASRDRTLEVQASNPAERHLFAAMAQAPSYGSILVDVDQKGGRPARVALVTLRAMRLRLRRTGTLGELPKNLDVNVVLACEEQPPKGETPLTWFLVTTEPVEGQAEVLRVVRYYRLRWRIEELHKAWKSGAGVEERRLQSPENLHRVAAILVFVAVRLLQLREYSADLSDTPCSELLPELHWKLLWVSVERKNRKPPTTPPTVKWAFQALGRLGGWKDTKRTGRVGWEAVWDGWFRLQERLDGYRLLQELLP
jgi:hypothetical protein